MTGTVSRSPATHCFGRHLIDLPARAVVNMRSVVGGLDVEVMRVHDRKEFDAKVNGREAELKMRVNKSGEDIFRERRDLGANGVLLTSWSSPNSKALYLLELYRISEGESSAYIFSGKSGADSDYYKASLNFVETLSEKLLPRLTNQVPREAGFCIEQGLVAMTGVNKEETTAVIRVQQRPGLTVAFTSYVTGRPDSNLLKRASSAPPGYEGASAGMRSLRRGERDIGPINGQELLVRGDAGGKRSYEFLWESQGEKASIEHPFLSLRMTTTDETDKNGEIMDAPFESDAEALALWDSILDTLRLRPGAINAGGAGLR